MQPEGEREGGSDPEEEYGRGLVRCRIRKRMPKRCRPIRPGEIRGCLSEEDGEGKVEGLSDPLENAEGEKEKG